MANNLNHFLRKADELAVEVEAIRNAVAILSKYAANDDEEARPTVAEFAHDIIEPTIEAPTVQIVAEPSTKHRGAADTLILDALSHEWQTARAIHEAIVGKGATITRSGVFHRLDVLTKRHPDQIEQKAGKKEWRAKGGDKAPKDADKQLPTLSPTITGKVRKVAATVAANDATIGEGLHHGDGLKLMKGIADQSVDLVLVDPPYGCTHNKKIDTRLDQDAMWKEYRRILKPNGTILMFAGGQFMADLIRNAPDGWFKYDYSWVKPSAPGTPDGGKNRPLRRHENVLLFTPGTTIQKTRSDKRYTYEPIGATKVLKSNSSKRNFNHMGLVKQYDPGSYYWGLENVPDSVLEYAKDGDIHPFQKPVAMLERLILTHSNEGDLILDNCAGSGSLAIAAINTNRRWIAMEMDEHYYGKAKARIDATLADKAA